MDITGAPAELVLGDGKYRMSALTDKDIAELDNWIRIRAIRVARQACEGASDAETDRIMKIAFEYANGLSWTSPQGNAVMTTLDGLAQLIWQGTHRNHPELTPEIIRPLIIDERTLNAAMDAFNMLNNVEAGEANAPLNQEKSEINTAK